MVCAKINNSGGFFQPPLDILTNKFHILNDS